MFNRIVPDHQLIKAIWVQALKGDAACLRLCAEFKWGKIREAPDLVPPKDQGDNVYIATLHDGTPLT